MWDFQFFPERASSIAGQVDTVYLVLIALAGLIAFGIATLIVIFGIRYRHGSDADRSGASTGNMLIESAWTIAPLVLAIAFFLWGASVYFDLKSPPPEEPIEVFIVAKQWMWKAQHPEGPREINTLHVPAGRLVRLTMTSQDVIHSFFVPAFRIKQDLLPSTYTNAWFEATEPGTYHLFCAEYCGANHSHMRGTIRVMRPAAYEEWLTTGATGGSDTEPGTGRFERMPADQRRGRTEAAPWEAEQARGTVSRAAMVERGRQLFGELRCSQCHRPDTSQLYPGRGPALQGIFGRRVQLRNGRTLVADADYVRESILYPQAKLVAGYPAVMPTFQGQISEEELFDLIAYLRSLGDAAPDTTSATDTTAADTLRPPTPAPTDS